MAAPPLPVVGQKRWADTMNTYLTWLGQNGVTPNGNGDYVYTGWIYDSKNAAGVLPGTTYGTAAIATNFSNGSNEVDFFNTNSAATSSFRFYQMTSSSTSYLAIQVQPVASAVNYLQFSPSATGTAVSMASAGTDANVGLNLQSKGTGTVQVNGAPIYGNPPRALSTQMTAQSIPNNVVTALTLDTNVVNVSGMWVTGSNTRLTCQTAGWYEISACAAFSQNSTGTRQCNIRLNGGATPLRYAQITVNSGSDAAFVDVATFEKYLNVGDYIELYVNQNSGAALNTWTGSPTLGSFLRAKFVST